jgi:hypothetical protein
LVGVVEAAEAPTTAKTSAVEESPTNAITAQVQGTASVANGSDAVVAEIKKVFGKNADGFIYILTTCRENTALNVEVVTRNRNGSLDVGLGRVNTVGGVRVSNGATYTVEQLKDYRTNIKVSYEIFQRQGWKAWYGCRDHNNGVYPAVL